MNSNQALIVTVTVKKKIYSNGDTHFLKLKINDAMET